MSGTTVRARQFTGAAFVLLAMAAAAGCAGTVQMVFDPPPAPGGGSKVPMDVHLKISQPFLDYRFSRDNYSTSSLSGYSLAPGEELAKVARYTAEHAFQGARYVGPDEEAPLPYIEPVIEVFDPGYGGATAFSTIRAHVAFAWTAVGPFGPIWSDTVRATAESRRGLSRGVKQTSERLRLAMRELATESVSAIIGSHELQSASMWLPLTLAAANGDIEAVDSLVSVQGNRQVADPTGRTPLMAAALNGQTEVVALLISHGADPYVVDSMGNTAVSYATESGDSATVVALTREEAERDWRAAVASGTVASFKRFLETHPWSDFAAEARAAMIAAESATLLPRIEANISAAKELESLPLETSDYVSNLNIQRTGSVAGDPDVTVYAHTPSSGEVLVPVDPDLFIIISIEDVPRIPDAAIAHYTDGVHSLGMLYSELLERLTLVIPREVLPFNLELRGLLTEQIPVSRQ